MDLELTGVCCCRSSSPHFQIFVNNRLSTTNMTLELDERLEVDNVDSFLILRSPDSVSWSSFIQWTDTL